MIKQNTKKLSKKIIQSYRKTTDLSVLKCVSESLTSLLPVLLISTFILVLMEFPLPAYQNVIKNSLGGKTLTALGYIYKNTYGMLSVYMTIAIASNINRHYGKVSHRLATIFVALASFFILSGAFNDSVFNADMLGPKNTFTAIICAVISSSMYMILSKRLVVSSTHYGDGIIVDYSTIFTSLIPIVLILEIFSCANLILTSYGYVSFYCMYTSWLSGLFSNMQKSVLNLVRFELLQNLLWSFGIHGSDVLSEIKYLVFDTAQAINKAQVAAGKSPTLILTGVFIDVFVIF